MEKSYLEIKVRFIHIVILLAGVSVIGILLFYIGFQAGKSSARIRGATPQINRQAKTAANKKDRVEIIQDKPVRKQEKSSINKELNLHKPKTAQEPSQGKEQKITGKPVKSESYYSIQVGSFTQFANAQKYSAKFSKLGYQSEILTTIKQNRKTFRVRIGRFKDLETAKNKKKILERMERKKFLVVKNR
jgi:cell division protein FtsN